MAFELLFPGAWLESIEFSRRAEKLVTGLLPRVSFANVRPRPPRGDSFDPLGVGTLTLPPASPPTQDDGRFRFSVEPFIVSRSDIRMCARLELTTLPIRTLDDVGYGPFESTLLEALADRVALRGSRTFSRAPAAVGWRRASQAPVTPFVGCLATTDLRA